MDDEYEVIKEFECHGKPIVTIRIKNAAHVMSQEEWCKIYGRNHNINLFSIVGSGFI